MVKLAGGADWEFDGLSFKTIGIFNRNLLPRLDVTDLLRHLIIIHLQLILILRIFKIRHRLRKLV